MHIIDDPLYLAALERKDAILRARRERLNPQENVSPQYEQPMHTVECQYFPCEIKDNF